MLIIDDDEINLGINVFTCAVELTITPWLS